MLGHLTFWAEKPPFHFLATGHFEAIVISQTFRISSLGRSFTATFCLYGLLSIAWLGSVCLNSAALAQETVTTVQEQTEENQESDPKADSETRFLSNARQLTFSGKRAGEGYFSADGTKMVFQSERSPSNPFFQIFVLDFETGDVQNVSPGHGKTTCAWIHPNNRQVLFASTHGDPEAVAKQRAEIAFRESGQARRYSWDYDENYELYSYDLESKEYKRLSDAKGYDAEGSYSPDGKLVAFASNRNAYSKEMSDKEKAAFEHDPAYMMDIFIMNADGTNVRQLTDTPGYDGGPFFSPDGKRICWRRFSPDGLMAEIFTMNIDGTDEKQLTKMNVMSWAPFYHPSGKYLNFTTNKLGFDNFEIYIVDAEGKSEPVRVTTTGGFDGLASFTPDGKKMAWTTGRHDPTKSKKKSQIHIADWNHEKALELIGRSKSTSPETDSASALGSKTVKETNPDFDPRDIMRHVDYLCRKELGGRMTGSKGEKKATAYTAAYMDNLGLVPAGDNGTWFQKFEFPAGAELGTNNKLGYVLNTDESITVDGNKVNVDWRPLFFSASKTIEQSGVVFAGYGIVAPEQLDADGKKIGDEYDSYVHLDVKDKWVMVFRFVPEDVSPKRRQHLKRFGDLRKKIFYAKKNGAAGLIVVSGPNSKVRKQLVPLSTDFSERGSSIAGISISDKLASQFFAAAGKDIKDLQTRLDDGSPMMGFDLKQVTVMATTDVKQIVGNGRNVVGRLLAGDKPSKGAILVGAHIDHLGSRKGASSLARSGEEEMIHFGADDNASGVAAMLEVAEYLASQKRKGKLTLKRDVIFAGWSGEELGLHGSKHFCESLQAEMGVADGGGKQPKSEVEASHDFKISLSDAGEFAINGKASSLDGIKKDTSLKFIAQSAPDFPIQIIANKEKQTKQLSELTAVLKELGIKNIKISEPSTAGAGISNGSIYSEVSAALNMDMVGRLEDKLVLQGIGSSDYWAGAIESKNAIIGLPLTLSNDTQLPTDASSFYRAGVPILSAFTGSHTDYHTPRDTPDKLNYPDAARIARLMGLITRSLATGDALPAYIEQAEQPQQEMRGGLRAYLGTIPAYGEDVTGVMLSGVGKGGPAEKAGVRGGDIIVELAETKIDNIYDYTAILEALKIDEETNIVVVRDGKRVELKITPGSRQ